MKSMAATLTTAATTQREAAARPRRVGQAGAAFDGKKRTRCCWRSPKPSKATRKAFSPRTAKISKTSGLEGAMRDRLLLTSARIKEMARGVRDVAALPDPIGETLAEWTQVQRPAHPQSARAARRGRHHLRIASERDGRYRGARAENRQRHRAARRQRSGAKQPAPGRDHGRRSRRSRRRDRIARFAARGNRCKTDQGPRPGRRHHSPRRRGTDHIRHREFHGACDRNRSRELPHLRRRVCRLRNGRPHRDQRQDAASVSLQRRREVAGARAHRGRICSAHREEADRRRSRSPRRR